MPKKAPKNAFYYYMVQFKEDQKKLGITYANLKEVAEAASPSWAKISPTEKAKYETIAKREKGDLEHKYNANGVPLSVIEQQRKDEKLAEALERREIKNIVKVTCLDQSIINQDFFIMDVIELCQFGSDYLIGEFTILKFNFKNGIKNGYHEYILPEIPLGFAHDVKLSQRTCGLDSLDESLAKDDLVPILANIIDYLKQNDKNMEFLPPIFTMPEKVDVIRNFMSQMCDKAAEDETLFRVYRLDWLLFELGAALRSSSAEGFPHESLASALLNKDVFKYTPGIACAHHESVDKSNYCTTSRVKRWAFTMMDYCCPLMGVQARPGVHLPQDFDIDSIISYREGKRDRACPSVAWSKPASEYNAPSSSTFNESFDEGSVASSNATYKNTAKGKRTFTPLRKPTADYSQRIQVAPEITESNFPKLGSSGHGRGRGLAASMEKMKIGK